MYRNGRCSIISADVNRSYMKALRELLGLKQYDILRLMRNERIIREAQISVIEGKIGLPELCPIYASYFRKLIAEENDHPEHIKELMLVLLKTWEEA